MINFTFKMFENRCKELAKVILKNKKIKYIVGIKRGGWVPAVRLSHLTGLPVIELDETINPEEIIIIDDIIDSGRTREKYKDYKNFFVLVDKQKEKINNWVVFFWEEK